MRAPEPHRNPNFLFRRPLRLLALLLVPALVACWTWIETRHVETANQRPDPAVVIPPYHEALVIHMIPADGEGEVVGLDQSVPFRFEIQPGETLGSLLGGLGLEPLEAHRLSLELAEHLEVRRLKAGSPYDAYVAPSRGLNAFALAVEDEGRVLARRTGESWNVSFRAFERSVRLRLADGTLEGALETAMRRAEAPVALTYRMAEALQWDLDFNRDLRLGDRFRVLYEQVYLDGRYHTVGPVLAVQYENRGRLIEAYRFGDDGGLYDEEGRPLRKMFLRSPLPYSRVTSGFSHRRFHPVLKRYRPHYGVDFGAPTGTPVRATAGGTVTFAGWDRGGGGNTIKLRHPNNFETYYLHLSRFVKGVSRGRPVRQGEVIGYVGSTGLSTGSHLDYRVKQRGRYINPLTIKSVPADPIPQKDLPAFLEWRDALRASLEQGDVAPVLTVQERRGREQQALEGQRLTASTTASAADAATGDSPRRVAR
jgi:murein DD-endopeptidase MepM/ murein hydrolase activator NlpD